VPFQSAHKRQQGISVSLSLTSTHAHSASTGCRWSASAALVQIGLSARAPCFIVLLLLGISARLVALSLIEAHATPDGPGWPSGWATGPSVCASSDPPSCAIQTVGLLPSNHPDSCRFVVLTGQHKQQTALAPGPWAKQAAAAQIKLCTRKWHAAYSALRRELLSLVRLLGPSPVCRETERLSWTSDAAVNSGCRAAQQRNAAPQQHDDSLPILEQLGRHPSAECRHPVRSVICDISRSRTTAEMTLPLTLATMACRCNDRPPDPDALKRDQEPR
jgi:hypothetical protein